MKTKTLTLTSAAAALALMSTSAFADYTDNPPEYVELKPLSELITQSPASMTSTQSVLQMPAIDWSGDFVTVHANGGTTTDPDSIFGLFELEANIYIENDLVKQATSFLKGDSPFFRGTQGQAAMLAPLTVGTPAEMIAVYKHSFSQGDHLVAKDSLSKPEDLCGATIAIMRYGPHVAFMGRTLNDAGCDISAMQSNGQIKWTANLTGENSPYHALVSDPSVDAAFVVTPDMSAMTEGGEVPGSKNLISTATQSRVITDGYWVRKDYFDANTDQIKTVSHALFMAGEELGKIMEGAGQTLTGDSPSLTPDQQSAMTKIAAAFPDSTKGGDPIEAGFFWLDADIAGFAGNVQWVDPNNPRGLNGLNTEVHGSLTALGLLSGSAPAALHANFDYQSMTEGLENTDVEFQEKFDKSKVAALIDQQQKAGTIDGKFEFEIFFDADQNSFPASRYEEKFKEVIDFASAYGNALITVEGHSGTMCWLIAQNPDRFSRALQGNPQLKAKCAPTGEAASRIELRRRTQTLRSLSSTRATAVRDAVIDYATEVAKVPMDPSQFVIVAHGINDPRNGLCDGIPCAPKSAAEMAENRRVVFQVVAVPAEADVFVAAD